jgi:hypothetical protein
MNTTVLYLTLPLMVVGLVAWNIAATLCKSWLKAHDMHTPSSLETFFIGSLFSSIGPVRRYAAARRSRNETTTMASVFWGGLAISWGGFAVLILLHFVVGRH